jgi:hypothetical protein
VQTDEIDAVIDPAVERIRLKRVRCLTERLKALLKPWLQPNVFNLSDPLSDPTFRINTFIP